MSCKKALEVLERKNIDVEETVDARKVKIVGDVAWKLLNSAKKVYMAKGKKLIEVDMAEADRFSVMQVALGRSGTLRAPSVRIGDTWIVGFNEEVYNKL